MCILFVSSIANTDQHDRNYKLILAANRDEYYLRPAKVADYWEEDSCILGGRDMEPGREGGTWLGMHKSGKIGVLLNILTQEPATKKLGRGSLVADYLKSPNLNGFEYSKKLQENAMLYNDFNLVTLDIKGHEPVVTYFSSGDLNIVQHKGTSITAFGNSLIETPFLKVADGKERMCELVKKFPKKSQKEQLISGLLDILKSKDRFYPDPQMQKQTDDIRYLEGMSSRFVEMPSLDYGSRTHTVILVDFDNQVEFHEFTMEMDPIASAKNQKWIHSKYEFAIN